MTVKEVPSQSFVVVSHCVVEVCQGRASCRLVAVTPAKVEAHDGASEHTESQEAIAVTDAAVIFSRRDIEAVVETCLDAPVAPCD